MAAMEDLFNLLLELSLSEHTKEVLTSIKTLLVTISPNELRNVSLTLPFSNIFNCLETDNSEEIILCCDVLNKLLASTDPLFALQEFHAAIVQGLYHQSSDVTQLVLQQIDRASEVCPQEILEMNDLLHRMVQLIGDESLSTARKVANILEKIGKCGEAYDVIFSDHMLLQFNVLLEKNDTIRFRVHELTVNLAQTSPQALNRCKESCMLTKLSNEIHKDDILLQLNSLELLASLAKVPHGMAYLEQSGVVDRIHRMLQSLDTDPMMGLLLPGIIKFFGNVARLHPKETCENHPLFLGSVFSMIDSEDTSHMILAIETIALISATNNGKILLEKNNVHVYNACRRIGQLVRDTADDYRVRALDAVAGLISLEISDQTAELLQLTQSWFCKISQRPMELMMEIAKQPFTKLRCAVFNVVCAIATQPWGQKTMNGHPGFNEYLLDRTTETEKSTKEGKYSIVVTLVDSPTAPDIYGHEYFLKLRLYHREGAYYVKVETAVAMESA